MEFPFVFGGLLGSDCLTRFLFICNGSPDPDFERAIAPLPTEKMAIKPTTDLRRMLKRIM